MEQLYSYQHAAEKLDISVSTLKRIIRERGLQVYNVGKCVRISESVLKQITINVEEFDLDNHKLLI